MKTNSKKDSAVSPVIGTILLVAITVVLVAIISAVVMGMTGNIGSSKVVGVQVGLDATNQQAIVTITGGADAKSLTKIEVFSDKTKSSGQTYILTQSDPKVGVGYTTARPSGSPAQKETINVVGTFSDGTTQTIYTGEFNFAVIA